MPQLLAGTAYDPATAVSFSTAAAAAPMTAIDTANLRLKFNAPRNGIVRVKMRANVTGGTTAPSVLLGTFDHTNGDALKARQVPLYLARSIGGVTGVQALQTEYCISGLVPHQYYEYDAACGIETGVASSAIKYGGPNDSTITTAWGAFEYEIWDAPEILACTTYDPAVSVSKSTAAGLAMTALDTTNLRLSFAAPYSGNVIVHLHAMDHGGTTSNTSVLLGALEGATVRCRQRATFLTASNTLAATDFKPMQARVLVTGLTYLQNYVWDAAYGVETVGTSLVYGGPDNSVADDGFGGFYYAIEDANPDLSPFDANIALIKHRRVTQQ